MKYQLQSILRVPVPPYFQPLSPMCPCVHSRIHVPILLSVHLVIHTHHFLPLPSRAVKPWRANVWLGLQNIGEMTSLWAGIGPSPISPHSQNEKRCSAWSFWLIYHQWQALAGNTDSATSFMYFEFFLSITNIVVLAQGQEGSHGRRTSACSQGFSVVSVSCFKLCFQVDSGSSQSILILSLDKFWSNGCGFQRSRVWLQA